MPSASIAAVCALLVAQWGMLILRPDDLSWVVVQQENLFSANPLAGLFVASVKSSVAINVALYCIVRLRIRRSTVMRVFTVMSFASFLVFAAKLGNRTDVLALFLGIFVFEASKTKLKFVHFARLALISAALLIFLILIESLRAEPADTAFNSVLEAALMKDYFSPAHILFAAIGLNYIDPGEVLTSNAANALILLGYPYLQATVTEMFNPGIATRSAGYAFYIFSEGWLFSGFSGFIYNSIVVAGGLLLWRRLANTRTPELKLLLIALFGSMVVNIARGQSSYFIKYIYTYVFPGVLMFLFFAGKRIAVLRPATVRHPRAQAPRGSTT